MFRPVRQVAPPEACFLLANKLPENGGRNSHKPSALMRRGTCKCCTVREPAADVCAYLLCGRPCADDDAAAG